MSEPKRDEEGIQGRQKHNTGYESPSRVRRIQYRRATQYAVLIQLKGAQDI